MRLNFFCYLSLALTGFCCLVLSNKVVGQEVVTYPATDSVLLARSTSQPINASASAHALTDVVPTTDLILGYVDSTSTPTAAQVGSPNSTIHVFGEGEGAEIGAQPRRFAYGLHLTIRGVYDDNINISNTDRESDFYFAIEPSVTLGFGDITGSQDNYIRLDYSPSIVLFLDHTEANGIQHIFHLEGQHHFGRLTLTLGQDVAILDGTDIRSFGETSSPGGKVNLDVGGRVRENIFTTHLNSAYDLTGKTFLTSAITFNAYDYPDSNLYSSNTIQGNLFANYRYSDKLTIGLGGTGGYNFVSDPNPNETFEQANVRLTYVLTGKINLNGSAGVEFRQFEDETRDTYVSPVFELDASYQMFDSTSFHLSGSRRTYNSAVLGGQDFAGTNLNASIRQRFFQRFFVGLSAGFEIDDYFATVSGISSDRHDDYFFVSPTVDFSVTRFWTVGAYYLHRQNDSSSDTFKFDDNQVGFRTSLTF